MIKSIVTRNYPRFRIEELERRIRRDGATDTEFCETIGITRHQFNNWRKNGIHLYSADKLAVSLGYHPSYFWPEYWEIPVIDAEPAILTN